MKKSNLSALVVISSIITFYACGGEEKKSTENTTTTSTEKISEDPTPAASSASGEDIYKKNCLACHQANGEGLPNAFPPLAKSDFLVNREAVIKQVIEGKTGELIVNGVTYNNTMPPQALSDQEIASVLTYVYSSWGNSGGPVIISEVNKIRGELQ